MKKFDYSKLGGFPLTQDIYDFTQQAFSEPLIALAKLGGTAPHIISGMVDDGTNVTDGFLYYNGDIIPFVGGAVGAIIKVTTYKTTLQYGDGNNYQSQERTEATFGTGAVQFNYADLKLFQEDFGSRAISDWQTITQGANTCYWKYNKLTKMATIRGSAVVPQNAGVGGTGIQDSLFTIPASIAPPVNVYFRTNLETHLQPYLFDNIGNLFTGSTGRVSGTNISINGVILATGTASPTQYFYVQYQL